MYLTKFGLFFHPQTWQSYVPEILDDDFSKFDAVVTEPSCPLRRTVITSVHKFRTEKPDIEKEKIDELPSFVEGFSETEGKSSFLPSTSGLTLE